MLQVFYLDVAYVCSDFQVFSGAFFKCFRSMFQVFHCMLQVLRLNVLKVDRANVVDLHLVGVDQISGGVSRLLGG
jgi:hypothetical protein